MWGRACGRQTTPVNRLPANWCWLQATARRHIGWRCGEYGAAGVIAYRVRDAHDYPALVESLQIVPREGPNGEPPAFVISISNRAGMALAARLSRGEKLVLDVDIEAHTRAGHYPQVHALLRGSEANMPEVWIQGHTNYRNGGGGNNLSGVGVTMDLARSLARLVNSGALPRPRRTIRFTWGAEHMAVVSYFHRYPGPDR